MGNTNRHSRAIFVPGLALLCTLALWFALFFASAQNPFPVAALQDEAFTATPLPTNTATPTVTPTPTGVLTVEKKSDPKLVEDLNGNARIDPGDTVSYIISYRNPGTANLTNVKIIDDYDQEAIASIAKITSDGTDDGDKITWTIGELPAGRQDAITYNATFKDAFPPKGPRPVENKVTIISDQTNAVPDSSTLEIMIPNLTVSENSQLTRDLNGNGLPEPGDTISYTIIVRNSADVEASNLLIREDYDEELLDRPVTVPEGSVDKEEGAVNWDFRVNRDLKRLDPGQEISVKYDAVVLSSLPLGESTGTNKVTVSSQGTEPIMAENTLKIAVLPTPAPTATEVPSTPSPEPVLAPASQSAGPTSQAISPVAQAWLAGVFLGAAALGLIGFAFLATRGDGREMEIPSTLRDGYILTLIMGAVIILGLAGSVERSAIAGLIGTVAGYILRGAAEAGSSKPRPEQSGQTGSRETGRSGWQGKKT